MTANFSIIGSSILYSAPSGNGDIKEVTHSLKLNDVVSMHIAKGEGRFIQIEDYAFLKSATLKARKYFLNNINSHIRRHSVIFYNLSPLLTIAVRIGNRLVSNKKRIYAVACYADAVRLALKLCDKQNLDKGAFVLGRSVRFNDAQPYLTPVELKTEKALIVEDDNFSISPYIIDKYILLAVFKGRLNDQLTNVFESLLHKLPGSSISTSKTAYVIVDVSGVSMGTKNHQPAEASEAKTGHDLLSGCKFILFGENSSMATIAECADAVLPQKVTIARDINHAFEIVRRNKMQGGMNPNTMPGEKREKIREYEKDLLSFLGEIQWENEGGDSAFESIEPGHPFHSVFTAIALIKEEIDTLFRERKAAIVTLEESEAKYRELFEKGSDLLCYHDLEGNILDTNLTIKKEYGWTGDRASHLNVKHLIVDRYRDDFDAYIQRILENRKDQGTVTVNAADGREIILEYNNVLVTDSEGTIKGISGFARDITEKVKAEKEKAHLEAQLQHAQKMESIGTLTSGIAHNFNNILMGIQGQISLISAKEGVDYPYVEQLNNINSYIKSASEMTRQLLGFASSGQMEMKPVDLNQLIANSLNLYGRIRKEIDIHMDFQEDIWTVEVDISQMEQVLLNLFVNAWQAMPGGGSLYIQTENTILDEQKVKPYSIEAGRYVKLSVTDTGVGIDAADQQKIFEPFFTTKKVEHGTGLGLASTYGIISKHKGFIDVYSEKEKGATFRICLPVSSEKVVCEMDEQTNIACGRETVLFVDDESYILDAGRDLLESLGYSVLVAENGQKAVEIFEKQRDKIALVILDVVMPVMDGSETFDRLRAIKPDVRILLSSGYSIEGLPGRILEKGGSAFIQKPYKLPELSQKIREMLDAGPS